YDIEAGLHDAEGAGGEHGTLVVEPAHQHVHAPVDPSQHVLFRYLAVLEDELTGVRAAHAELVELGPGGEAGEAPLDQEGSDSAGAGIGIRARVDDQNVRVRPVGDPHL